MKRILIIGSPGSGKSTLSFSLAEKLKYPILHLDRIYHIDNTHAVTRDVFLKRLRNFITQNRSYIIDGNYTGTLEERIEDADTIIHLDFDTEICLENIEKRRLSNQARPDMAPGFDNSIKNETFYSYVRTFRKEKRPRIMDILNQCLDKKIYVFHTYKDLQKWIDAL